MTREDCALCGEGEAERFLWGQDNIGIFSLNTFEVVTVSINRYDPDNGTPVQRATGVLRTQGGKEEAEGGFSAPLTLDADYGMAVSDCAFREDAALNVERAAESLCQSCLERAMSGDGTGVGVVDLATREFRPLEEAASGFGLGNYYIHCDWDSGLPGAKLWIFYMPPRAI